MKFKKLAIKIPGVDIEILRELVDILKSLGDESRLQIVLILAAEGPMTVTQLRDRLCQSQPSVSHHLQELRHAKLVTFIREGKKNIYHLEANSVLKLIRVFFPKCSFASQRATFGELEFCFRLKEPQNSQNAKPKKNFNPQKNDPQKNEQPFPKANQSNLDYFHE